MFIYYNNSMDINNTPNIIMYDTLTKYIIENHNYSNILFNNIYLINLNIYSSDKFNKNIINLIENINNNDNINNGENIISNDYIINYIYNYNYNSINKSNLDKNNYSEQINTDNQNTNKENYENENFISEENNENNELFQLENLDSDYKSSEPNDPWESSINDDKFYINNKVARIFPVLKNFNNFSKIKIDDESFCFITIREIADMTSKIICYHLLQYNLNPQKIKIADYTSGVGGNVLSFSKYFKYIYAVEICSTRAEFLENNINIYGLKNINVINKCAIEFNSNDLININPSVIFMDPPWGGSNYKSNENLLLKLGSVGIEELIIDITQKFSNYYLEIIKTNPKEKTNNYNNKFIILKLPKNYDIEYLYNYLKNNNKTKNYNISSYLYILNKMIIVVCELQFSYI